MAEKAVFNWSGGKDSALALWNVLQGSDYDVVALLTSVNSENRRSSLHGIPIDLLRLQAEQIGLPLHILELPPNGGMAEYEAGMESCVRHFKETGVSHFIFGDIFLEDVRNYREEKLHPFGITVVEPLWGKSSAETMEEFLDSGLQTVIVATTADSLGKDYIGKIIDRELVKSFPEGIDICGEYGEYHTFCYAGGMFRAPVPFTLGEPLHLSYETKDEQGNARQHAYWAANLNITSPSLSNQSLHP